MTMTPAHDPVLSQQITDLFGDDGIRPPHLYPEEWQARIDLALAYRLAAAKGWDDLIYTHLSLALSDQDDAYLINRFGLLFTEVTPLNLVKVNINGDILDGEGPVNRTGFAIHSAVHAARADARCVIHLHNDSAIAVSSQPRGLLPLSQQALRFYNDIAYHDYEGLALSAKEQQNLLNIFGNKKAALLRNHGSLVCGHTVAQAFYLMDTLDKACRIQILAGSEVTTPTPSICDKTYQQLIVEGDIEGQLEWPVYIRWLIKQSKQTH